MSISFDFFDFSDPVQAALRMLRGDIRDNYRSDFDGPTIATCQHMQTWKVCRQQRSRVALMDEIAGWLDEQCDVYLWGCDTDSPGDQWIQQHGLWNGEAA